MRINHNLTSINTNRQLGINVGAQSKSIEKLSSGLRINRAGDDAAGLSISEKMRNQIRGLDQASRNSQDAISLIQTTEGALNESHSILARQRELIIQAGNKGTSNQEDLQSIKDEIIELNSELTGITQRTEFNGKKLLDGNYTGTFQIGANTGQTITFGLTVNANVVSGVTYGTGSAFNADGLGTASLEFLSASFTNTLSGFNVDNDLLIIDGAIKSVSAARSKLGANQNRLEHTIKNLDNASENLTAAESRIRDVDMAKEMMEQTKLSILTQASQAMLAQSNQVPQGVLQLLR